MLKNLLSNALKFTDAGRRRAARSRGSPAAGSRFEVKDTGIGIPADQHRSHLRGVPPGRRHHQPQVRRHRAGAVDLARSGAPAGRRARRSTARPVAGSTFTLILPERLRACGRPSAAPAALRRPPAPPASRAGAPRRVPGDPPRRRRARPTLDGRQARTHPDRRGRSELRRACFDLAHELDFQSRGGDDRRTRAGAGRALSPERDRARRRAARSVGALRARHAQARLEHPPHPGPRRLGRRLHARRRWRWAPSATRSSRSSASSWSRRSRRLETKFTQRLRRILIVEDDDVARDSTCRLLAGPDVETVAVGDGGRRAGGAGERHLRLHGARPLVARSERSSSSWKRCRGRSATRFRR